MKLIINLIVLASNKWHMLKVKKKSCIDGKYIFVLILPTKVTFAKQRLCEGNGIVITITPHNCERIIIL